MKNKKQNEELQNRREFFKSAAKKALPIIGAIVLTSSPIIAKTTEKEEMGCGYGCMYDCGGSCAGDCYGSCRGGCMGCRGGCIGGCKNTCGGSGCRSTCSGTSSIYVDYTPFGGL